LIKILKSQGCILVKHGGNHDMQASPRSAAPPGKALQRPAQPARRSIPRSGTADITLVNLMRDTMEPMDTQAMIPAWHYA
jgi:hypothetical protein